MFLTLQIPWSCIDATHAIPTEHVVAAGKYAVERIANPFGFTNHPWIVLRGTKIGAPEAFWLAWRHSSFGAFSVQLEEGRFSIPR